MEVNKEAQEEELEVLKSIYEGDEHFKALNDNTFQYKFGEEGEKGTVLIEVQWPADYPTVCPKFSLGTFYNNHLSADAKRALIASLEEESTVNEGSQQTYTMIEWARESYLEVITPFLNEDASAGMDALTLDSRADKGQEESGKSKVKKEQLTKSQKRREWDKVDSKGEKARGIDWVDVVKHLSQTGSSRPEGSSGVSSTESYLPSCDLPS